MRRQMNRPVSASSESLALPNMSNNNTPGNASIYSNGGESGFYGTGSGGLGGGAPSVLNLDAIYKNNTKYTSQDILPPNNYNSPYNLPFKNIEDPSPVDLLIYRFSIWKMILKQIIFYFKEMTIFKDETYKGNRAMLTNLADLNKQNSGKLKVKANANKNIKKSISSGNFNDLKNQSKIGANQHPSTAHSSAINFPLEENVNQNFSNLDPQKIVNKLLQTAFLPPGEMSVLSISSTFFNCHNYLRERNLITYQQLTNKLIPRLEILKDELNEVIKQMSSIKNNEYKTKNLKMEIAKTGSILSDYIQSVQLLKTGSTKSSLGTPITLKNNKIDPKLDPYILKLKLDLQIKDQLYIEAYLKEKYYDLQFKAVTLEKILYTEIQTCISSYTDLINAELNTIRDNLIEPLKNGFLRNEPTVDWDYFIKNDSKKNFLDVNAKDTLNKVKTFRKNSDIIYPYRNSYISSCIYSGYLDRKSKFLKTYSKFFYVLTINFLHEFKSNDRIHDLHPIQSFSLTDVKVSAVENDSHKFIIRANTSEKERIKFTLKSENSDSIIKWITYLSDLTEIENTIERNNAYDDDDSEDEYSDNENLSVNNTNTNANDYFQHQVSGPLSPTSPNSLEYYQRHTQGGTISPPIKTFNDMNLNDSSNVPKPSHSRTSSEDLRHYENSVGNVSFKSIKNLVGLRQSSQTSLPISSNSRSSSRNSSRASSRASSPSRGRAANISVNSRSVLSPKLTPTGSIQNFTSSTSNNNGGDYFSYAPRKVQASIIRNGNRLASSSNNGRLTPGGSSTALNKNFSSTSVSDLSKLNTTTSTTPPTINILGESPVVTEKPPISTQNSAESVQEPNISGLQRRRKTLSEKLDISGLSSSNKNSSALLNLPVTNEENDTNDTSHSNNHSLGVSNNEQGWGQVFHAGLPETPGIIPGSMMRQVFNPTSVSQHTPYKSGDSGNTINSSDNSVILQRTNSEGASS